MAEINDSGEVALRLLDEIVIRLQRRDILAQSDVEDIVSALVAEAERLGDRPAGLVSKRASARALGWLAP